HTTHLFALYLLSHITAYLFFSNNPAPPTIYTLSLHDALPISGHALPCRRAPTQWLVHAAPGRRGQTIGWSRVDGPGHKYPWAARDRKSTRLNSSHSQISYAVFCLKKKKKKLKTKKRSIIQ